LFYKTDTHWNRFGAYFAYREFMKSISLKYDLEIIDLSISDFTFKPSERTFDLPSHAGIDPPPPDIDVFLQKYLSNYEMEVKHHINDQNYVNVHPNTGLRIEYNPASRNIHKNKRILIFADSFMSFMANFMNNTFEEVQYIHHNSTDTLELSYLINQFQPHIVLFEVAERNIITAHNKNNSFFSPLHK
jgi:alginate O-acetyltransferase complex protein AlgJ